MCKYFIAVCIAALCTVDFSSACQQNIDPLKDDADQLATQETIEYQENEIRSIQQRIGSEMVKFAKKYGLSALKKKVGKFVKSMQSKRKSKKGDTLIKEELTNEEFVDRLIECRFIRGLNNEEEKNDLPKLRPVMVSFVEKKGRTALVEKIIGEYEMYTIYIAYNRIDRFIRSLQREMLQAN